MKKLAIGLSALILLVIIGLLVVPLFITTNDFKQIIQTKFKERTGFELVLTGDIELSLFPMPKASVNEVIVSNNSRVLVTVKNITAYPKLGDLISGEFVVDGLDINNPKLIVEKIGGQHNWQKTSYGADQDSKKIAEVAESATKLSINSITINDGHIEYRDKDKDKNYVAKNIQTAASLSSLNGPLKFSATADFMDEKVSLRGDVENFSDSTIDIMANFMGSKISWEGGLNKAKLAVKTKDVSPIIKKFKLDEMAHLEAKPIHLSAEVTRLDSSIQLQDILLEVAETKGGGKVIIMPSEDIVDISMILNFQNLNIEDVFPQSLVENKSEQEQNGIGSKKEFRESISQRNLVASIAMNADIVKYKSAVLDEVRLQATYDDSNIVISQLSSNMAGTGKVEIAGILNKDSNGKAFDGRITAESSDFRKFLNQLGVDTSKIKADTLGKFLLASDIYMRIREETKFNFSKIESVLDESQFSGSVDLTIADKLSLDINGALGSINLDQYLEKKVVVAPITLEEKKQRNLENELKFDWLKNLNLIGKTDIFIGDVIYHGIGYSNIKIQSEFKPKEFDFSNISAASKDFQFALRGGLDITGLRPKLFVEANLGPVNTIVLAKTYMDKDLSQKDPEKDAERWSKDAFDFKPLDEIDIDFVVNSPMIDHKGMVLDEVSLKGYLESSKISLDKLNAIIFGGRVVVKGRFGIGAVPSADVNFIAKDIDLSSLAENLLNNDRIHQGKMTINGGLRTAGVHQRAMAENLEGSITLAGRDVWIKGFDVDAFASQITNISGPEALIPVGKALTGDSNHTRISSIIGSILCGQGVLKPQDLRMNTSYTTATYEGYADIVKWYMDTRAFFKISLNDSKERPGLGLRMFGSISEPKQEKDFDELISHYSKRFARGILKIPQKEEVSDPEDQLKNEMIQKGAEGLLKGLTQ